MLSESSTCWRGTCELLRYDVGISNKAAKIVSWLQSEKKMGCCYCFHIGVGYKKILSGEDIMYGKEKAEVNLIVNKGNENK